MAKLVHGAHGVRSIIIVYLYTCFVLLSFLPTQIPWHNLLCFVSIVDFQNTFPKMFYA